MSTNFDSAASRKKWCVMVYFAADIDLEAAAMADLEQMKVAGSSAEVDLLAQLNPGGSRAIRRYHLQKDTYIQEDLVPTFQTDGSEHFLNNVSAKTDLVEFVRWCASRSDAEHYALILWGHGQGWKADNPDPCFLPGAGNPTKTLGQQLEALPATRIPVMPSMPLSLPVTLLNGETGFLTNDDLREALAEAKGIVGKNIDILGLDACLMAMAEICCQVDQSVDYLIACEDTVPDESWPYDSILRLLVANAERMTPEDFARVVVWKFIFDFGQKRKFVTQSICQLGTDQQAALNKFTVAVDRLVGVLLAEIKDPETRWAAMVARSQVQSFYMKDYVDLYDYCRLLYINCKNPNVTKACHEVMAALTGSNVNGNGNGNGASPSGLIVDHGTYGYPLKLSFGLSVFFPCVGAVPGCYAQLEFCKRTRWHEFLAAYLVSPAGQSAVFEAPEEWPSEIPDEQPSIAPAAQPAVVAAINAAPSTMATLTATGVVLENNNGSSVFGNGDGLKTTYGDVIKTSHGDPIKKPQLPVWMLPSAPKLNATVLPGGGKGPVKPDGRGCGSKM